MPKSSPSVVSHLRSGFARLLGTKPMARVPPNTFTVFASSASEL